MTSERCPCKKTACKRHGDCEACKAFHRYPLSKPSTACERIKARDERAKRTAEQSGDTPRVKGAAHTGNIVLDWYETKKNVDEMKHGREGRLKQWERTVAAYFPRGARILDIGCGMGREAFALTDAGFAVTGLDISNEVIAQVNVLSGEQGRTIPFLLYDGHHLPFENASFDAVIIWAQTFGLLYGDVYKASFLKECARVLSKGGLLSFSGHDAEYLEEHYRAFVKGRKFYPYADTALYWETFFADDLSSRAEKAGYDIILCGRGAVYAPEDGTILHCLCRKQD